MSGIDSDCESAPIGLLAEVDTADLPVGVERSLANRDRIVLLVAFVAWSPLAFLGYGSDNDTYLSLEAGRNVVVNHVYTPSRNPGYPVYEVASYLLSVLGGSVLVNLVTMVLALLTVWCFLVFCRENTVPFRAILGVLFALSPVDWIAATSSIDYFWSLGFVVIGCFTVRRNLYVLAVISFALSLGCRLSTFILVVILLYYFYAAWQVRGRTLTLVAAGVVVGTSLLYVPSFISARYTLSFLSPAVGPDVMWTIGMRAGRFAYKNLLLWGVPLSLVLGAAAIRVKTFRSAWRNVGFRCSVMIFAGYESLFFVYPIESSYLLPAIPFLLVILGFLLRDRYWALALAGVFLVVNNFVSFTLAEPDQPGRATSASLAPGWSAGQLVEDIGKRESVLHCSTFACWDASFIRWQHS